MEWREGARDGENCIMHAPDAADEALWMPRSLMLTVLPDATAARSLAWQVTFCTTKAQYSGDTQSWNRNCVITVVVRVKVARNWLSTVWPMSWLIT